MIPPIIHQMWLDKSTKTNVSVPSKYQSNVDQLRSLHSHWTYMFWNRDKVEKLFRTEPDLKPFRKTYQSMPHHIQKCDFARYAILYCLGGIYMDLDFHCHKSLDRILQAHPSLLLVYEPQEHSSHDPVPRRLYNGFLGSSPRHRFWLEWMTYIQMSLTKTSDVMETTGPVNFARFMLQAPSHYRNPEHFADTCDIIPIASIHDKIMMCAECQHRDSQPFDPQTYHLRVGNYTDTYWNEGTHWSSDKPSSSTSLWKWILFILLIVVIILFIRNRNHH